MDLRNVVFAIALSFAVLFGWSTFFETPQIEEQKKFQETEGKTSNNKKKQSSSSFIARDISN